MKKKLKKYRLFDCEYCRKYNLKRKNNKLRHDIAYGICEDGRRRWLCSWCWADELFDKWEGERG